MGWYPFKVTYAICSTDPKPCVEYFATEDSAIDWRNEEVERRVDYRIQHSPHSISEQEREHMVEEEMSLTKLIKIKEGV